MKNLDIMVKLLSYDGASTNDPADAVKVNNRIQETITALNRYESPIVTGTTNLALNLPVSPCDYAMVLVDQQISITVNGSGTPQTLKPRIAGKRTLVYFCKGPITSMSVTNASGSTANLDVLFIKE